MDASARLRDDLVWLDSFRAQLARGDHSAGSVSLSTSLSKAAESVLGLTTKGLSSGLQIRRCRRLKRSEHARACSTASGCIISANGFEANDGLSMVRLLNGECRCIDCRPHIAERKSGLRQSRCRKMPYTVPARPRLIEPACRAARRAIGGPPAARNRQP